MSQKIKDSQHADSLLSQMTDDSPCYLRILKKVDFFSFIPVPKDAPVSTKRSLIGSILFIVIFFSYVLWDGIGFILHNPPISQTYYSPISDKFHQVPDFAITFMNSTYLNQTKLYEDYMNYIYTQQYKDRGQKNDTKIDLSVNRANLDWIDNKTKQFYSILRSPSEQGYARGLLYSTSNASYTKITIQKCNLNQKNNNTCAKEEQMSKFFAGGRIFLFIKNTLNDEDSKDVPYLIYNFFLIPDMYKRVIIELQYEVIKTNPDYFFNWFEQQETRISISSVTEQTSNTSYFKKVANQSALQMLGITFQMAPRTANTIITYETSIDHVSKWGATWGVLFAIFAIIFLTHNRDKFYVKNPDWDRFKRRNQIDVSSQYGDAPQFNQKQ